ncbi:MAG: hypothetical protein MRJ93_12050 [Nitrososphaeraceae archaeon]|nr:hypothetical protein [Nitrososphaeraceae archaeon]
MTTADIERFENELSLYEKEVDCNEKFYKLYLLNMEIVKKILETAQKNYDTTDDPRVKAMEINVIKQMTESLKTYEDNLLETKNNYEFQKRYLESLR